MWQASGHLIDLAVHEGDIVEQGALLGRIHKSADPDAVAQVEAAVAEWGDDQGPSDVAVAKLATLPLGELQGDYAALERAHAAYAYQLSADPIGVQMRALTAQREPLSDRIASLQRQREFLGQEIVIAKPEYMRTTELARHQGASLLTLDDREHAVLVDKRAYENVVVDVSNTRLELDRIPRP